MNGFWLLQEASKNQKMSIDQGILQLKRLIITFLATTTRVVD